MSVILLILGLILFVGLVIIHEFGHFIMARRGGVEVEEFGLGFPPTVWLKRVQSKKGDFDLTINALPLGGFVKLKGENDADKRPGSFGAANLLTKIKIMLAGVVMNLLTAFILFTFLALIGMPVLIQDQFSVKRDAKIVREVEHKGEIKIDTVTQGGPADKAGLKSGDLLVAIGTDQVSKAGSIIDLTRAHSGQVTEVTYLRDGERKATKFQFGDNKNNQGYMGISTISNESGVEVRRYTWSAPVVAVGFMKQVTVATFKGLGSALRGLGSIFAGTFTANKQARQAGQAAASQQVSGPLGVFFILKAGTALGIQFVLMIIGIISLTLAIMNVLPIPALDGGRLFVTLIYRGLRKPLKKSTEEWIHGTGFAVLMLLFLVITFVDVKRFF